MAHKRIKPHTPRASWSGMLQFGLVTFPVQAINAHLPEGGKVAFHQLHAECHSRVRHQKQCPIHGDVEQDEIVSGFKVGKDRYVEVEPEELEKLRTDSERALTIETCIAPEQLDPIYLDGRMYYLAPANAEAREPYSVILEALRRTGRYAIGQVVFSGKEQLVLIRPYEDSLQMAMLNYAAEMRDPEEAVGELPHLAAHRGRESKHIQLAERLIESMSEEKFDISQYVDPYYEKVKELVAAKIEGRELVTPEAEEEPEIINLTEALRRSVEEATGRKPRRAMHVARLHSARSTRPHAKRRRAS